MKRGFIISPYFPPTNAADMHRIRMSLPYFNKFNWEVEIVTVDPAHSDLVRDELLVESIPSSTIIHQVKALSKKWTSNAGLGSIALRSLWFFKNKVNILLKLKKYDLIYFSTTQFPVCILGAYWKKRFGIPYVIDMQDPWHSNYYEGKPKDQRPTKYWFSYRLNRWLEPKAMRQAGGFISVSNDYINDLKGRYPEITEIHSAVIPFGAFAEDFQIADRYKSTLLPGFKKQEGFIDLVYVGRGGKDLHKALRIIFEGFKKGLNEKFSGFENFRFHFIGTSYAAAGEGTQTIVPFAREMDLLDYVNEDCNRLPYYRSIRTLQEADLLIVPGSDDPKYTASKIFNFILAKKPLLAVFSPTSSTYRIVKECEAGEMISMHDQEASLKVYYFLQDQLSGKNKKYNLKQAKFNQYSSLKMTKKQCELFDAVI